MRWDIEIEGEKKREKRISFESKKIELC